MFELLKRHPVIFYVNSTCMLLESDTTFKQYEDKTKETRNSSQFLEQTHFTSYICPVTLINHHRFGIGNIVVYMYPLL